MYMRSRQTSGTLFNLLERVHDWDAYLRQASETDKHFVGDTPDANPKHKAWGYCAERNGGNQDNVEGSAEEVVSGA